mmetsp:Transcript_25864/g.37048  ORF Transcript_25864/g.37048 Transcript_25864/m.37048 type:complete len:205 (-) Transcript_25864:70-684(-)|eukprot:CAMPEP_0172432254 /NCGR_PEP_ID=MMETSP1064-20121228/62269_1 /TAXON_ID=202472 /ORGANISM="Aulacoseira subarctica , Strain CCAP 1002/5" /LENGTH=204 /DNA_ID=CAMNT_0013179423 /DNA_START=59 /DNA_END=673 /DNA_ORIENTATION=+
MSRPPMSMMRGGRGRGAPGGRTSSRGGGSFGRGRGAGFRDEGPPSEVVEVGKVMHECESEMVCSLSHATGMIPYFNAAIFLENKKKIGKVDEIFGPLQKIMFTVKPDPGIFAKSFVANDLVYISTDKLLPLSRFTNSSSSSSGGGGQARGRGGGGARGGRGGRGARGGGGRTFSGRSSPGRGGGRGSPAGRSFGRGRAGGRGRF